MQALPRLPTTPPHCSLINHGHHLPCRRILEVPVQGLGKHGLLARLVLLARGEAHFVNATPCIGQCIQ